MKIHIDRMSQSDWENVRKIYDEGIRTGNATFEKNVPDWPEWDRSHLKNARLVARWEGKLKGWAALSPVSERCVYGGVAEVSVYVAADAGGQGIGTALLNKLIESSEESGIWTLQAGIFPENQASVAMHKKCGFKILGIREKLGKMDGMWRDVVMMERRSKVVGTT